MTAPDHYRCPGCNAVSYNPTDRAQAYCGRCKRYAVDLFPDIAALGLGNYGGLCLRDGVVCGLAGFAYTTAIMVGMSLSHSYARRYCYEHAFNAWAELELWDGTGHPGGPWLKCKGQMPNGTWVDELGPGLLLPDA